MRLIFIEGSIPPQLVAVTDNKSNGEIAAIERLQNQYPGIRIEKIDGRLVRGICNKCHHPIMEDETNYRHDSDTGVYQCGTCFNYEGPKQ